MNFTQKQVSELYTIPKIRLFYAQNRLISVLAAADWMVYNRNNDGTGEENAGTYREEKRYEAAVL